MPIGSFEGFELPQSLELLKTRGRDVTVTLRDVALEMQGLIGEDDQATTRDVVASVATRLCGFLDMPDDGRGGSG
ncbi:hypothetical protein BH20ACT9_BH20ACT9_10890 [soil metagenome]